VRRIRDMPRRYKMELLKLLLNLAALIMMFWVVLAIDAYM